MGRTGVWGGMGGHPLDLNLFIIASTIA